MGRAKAKAKPWQFYGVKTNKWRKARIHSIQQAQAAYLLKRTQGHSVKPGCSSNAVAVNFPDAPTTSRRKSDLYSTSSIKNTTPQSPQASSTSKGKEVTASSLYFNNFGLEDCINEDTGEQYGGISDDNDDVKLEDIDDDNIRDPASYGRGTSMVKDDLLDDGLDLCLICGHLETAKDCKQAASSFQWKISGNERDSLQQIDPLAPDTCADVHLLPIFVLLKLLKFPEDECAKIYKKTFGVLNPADWFILCEKCVKAAHKAYCVQVQIRQLEKKFEACQDQLLSQVKACTRKTTNKDDVSTVNILNVRELILGFYSDKFLSDSMCRLEPEQRSCEPPLINFSIPAKKASRSSKSIKSVCQEMVVNKSKNAMEPFEIDATLEVIPEASTSSALIKLNLGKTPTKINNSGKLGAQKRTRRKRNLPTTLKRLAMKKSQDELIDEHMDCETPNMFRCKLCPPGNNSVSNSRKGFAYHLALAHKPLWESVSDYVQCDHCGISFAAGASFRNHIRKVHRATCPHICHLCGNGYQTEGSLRYHLKTHDSGESKKPVKQTSICDYCGIEFQSNKGLSRHIIRFHSQSDNGSEGQSTGRAGISSQRKCKHCALVCVNFRELQLHLKSVHPELFKHKCEECDAAYISRSNLQVHVNSIHRQTKLKCKNCPKLLSTAAGMCFHLKYNCRGSLNQNLANDTN